MNENLNLPKYIIVLGTNYSGAEAIYTYFAGRGDLYDPLMGKEYQLSYAPHGLMALEAAAEKAFHPSTAEFALAQFENIAQKLARSQTIWRSGMNYASKLPLFQNAIGQFINEICPAQFSMQLHWRRFFMSVTQRIISLIKNKLGVSQATQARLLVSKDELVIAAQRLHNRIFQLGAEGRPVLLNQAGTGWNPIESTKYFSNCKVVLVTRDPRDQFVELKQFKKATSVEGFVDWYKEMQRRLRQINHPTIIQIRFEDFVEKNDKIVEKLCNQMSLPSNVSSSYQPNLSKKNVGKYRQYLSQKELDIIERQLSEFNYVN